MKAYSYHSSINESPFIHHFANVLGIPKNTSHAKSILCAFFQTIRAQMPLFASRALLNHLPNEVRTIYKDGWHLEYSPTFDYDAFINRLYNYKGFEHLNVFCSKNEAETAVSAVFEVIKEESTEEEYEDLMSFMPLLLRVNLMHVYQI